MLVLAMQTSGKILPTFSLLLQVGAKQEVVKICCSYILVLAR